MPTYEYVCESCKYEFEAFQNMSEDPLKQCPECNKKQLKRKIGTGAGIIFKGSGFYGTDYRSESYNAAANKEKESSKTDTSDKKKEKQSGKSDQNKEKAK